MADAFNFPSSRVVLGDWTIQALASGSGIVQFPVSGSKGASGQSTYGYVTANTVPGGTTQLSSGQVAEVLYAEVQPPVFKSNTTGALTFPDFNWWPVVDGNNDLQQYMNFDGSYQTNMTPQASKLASGASPVLIGISMRRLLSEAMNGNGRANMALLATGIKYTSNISIKAASSTGWPGSGYTMVQPARVRLIGEIYNEATLGLLGAYYQGAFSRTEIRRTLQNQPQISGQQNGVVGLSSWASLPGGYKQTSGAQVWRYFNYSVNLNATTANTVYALTNSQQAYGASGHVGLTNDLGYAFGSTDGNPANANDALIVQQFGVAGGIANIAYAGFKVGSVLVPEGQGFTLDSVVDDFQYGNTAPAQTGTGLWYPIPAYEGELSVFGENASAFIQDNGTAVAANAATVAIGGVSVKLAS